MASIADRPTSGLLNVNKPSGITSFDVVARVRKAAHIRRVGHAGTLDPLASGVLLVCLGQATRVISYLQDAAKTYLAGIRLGQLTDTFDSQGEIVREVPVPESIDLRSFVGDVWQRPPIYSALKREGRPLYEYARNGTPVDIEPRLVRIDDIQVVEWQPPLLTIRVTCGKGTYIRSLANDLGGHLISLVREAVGRFRVEDSMALDQLSAWENYLVPVEAALQLPHFRLGKEDSQRVAHGMTITAPSGECLAFDEDGELLALLEAGHPRIVFGKG